MAHGLPPRRSGARFDAERPVPALDFVFLMEDVAESAPGLAERLRFPERAIPILGSAGAGAGVGEAAALQAWELLP
jgi:hypothetical protein